MSKSECGGWQDFIKGMHQGCRRWLDEAVENGEIGGENLCMGQVSLECISQRMWMGRSQ
ncbi:hypothetical protein QG37_00806 [Candidozyma auris]|uniref:Uncharacterized protein n=1 Tax=Candidozyma auris TaxID=498019 RepID=A0A0L0P6Z0_CANAR|nr:hypothetical protein QG37_00806 [[Candida] auris]